MRCLTTSYRSNEITNPSKGSSGIIGKLSDLLTIKALWSDRIMFKDTASNIFHNFVYLIIEMDVSVDVILRFFRNASSFDNIYEARTHNRGKKLKQEESKDYSFNRVPKTSC